MQISEDLIGENHEEKTGKKGDSDRLAFEIDHRGVAPCDEREGQKAFDELFHICLLIVII